MTVPAPQSISNVIEIKTTQDKEVPSPSSPPKEGTFSKWCASTWRGIVAEFVSTTMLLILGCMSCSPIENTRHSMYAPFSFGFIVLINIQIFGHISGAFMNPSMTLFSVIWGNTSITLAIVYTIVHCLAAIAGYGILIMLTPFDIASEGTCTTVPYAGQSAIQTMFTEFLITSALAFITCAVWDPANAAKQDSVPLKFAFTIAGLSLVAGPLTGASMNPARTLGPALWTGVWTHHWAYWVGPLAGSCFATVFYKLIFLKKNDNYKAMYFSTYNVSK